MAASSMTVSTRLIGLDLLRLLAVALVLLCHLEMEPVPEAWASSPMLNVITSNGTLGVNLFFVLSGFLVSGLLFSEYKKRGHISVSRFYIRRAWKIYPPLYAMLAFTYLYSRIVLDSKIHDRIIFTEVFFLQNYLQGYWNHTWSLAVEEHFYIALPLIVGLMARRSRGAANPFHFIPRLVIASSVLVLIARVLNYACRTNYSHLTHVFPTHLRIDALFFGVGIAYAYHFYSDTFQKLLHPRRYALIAGSLFITAAQRLAPISAEMADVYGRTLGLTQEYICCGAFMAGVLLCEIPKNWLTSAMAALGAYSYSTYLWHMAIIHWVTPHLRDSVSWEMRAILYLVGAFVIGIAMAKLWELPLLRLRDRLFPSMTSQAAPVLVAYDPNRHAARSESPSRRTSAARGVERAAG